MSKDDYLKASFFEGVLKSESQAILRILSVKSEPASAAGEAYSSVVLRVILEVLFDGRYTLLFSYRKAIMLNILNYR